MTFFKGFKEDYFGLTDLEVKQYRETYGKNELLQKEENIVESHFKDTYRTNVCAVIHCRFYLFFPWRTSRWVNNGYFCYIYLCDRVFSRMEN